MSAPHPPQPGAYAGVPFDIYQTSEGVSVSMLKRFAEAPIKATIRADETPALRLGSLIHCAVLEPHRVNERYVVTDLDRRGTKAWEAAVEAASGRELVKRADWEAARRIRDAVHAHPIARDLLTPDLLVEQSLWWTDAETGVLCRGRPDGVLPTLKVVVDVKSTADAGREDFGRACANYRYHWQEAFYRAGVQAAFGWEPDAFVFIAVEKEPPYLVAAYEIDPYAVMRGQEQVRETLRRYDECRRAGQWPGYSEALERLYLPEWALM